MPYQSIIFRVTGKHASRYPNSKRWVADWKISCHSYQNCMWWTACLKMLIFDYFNFLAYKKCTTSQPAFTCSKPTIEIREQWVGSVSNCSGLFLSKIGVVLLSLLLSLNIFHTYFTHISQLWTCNCQLGQKDAFQTLSNICNRTLYNNSQLLKVNIVPTSLLIH